jgi:hypothetical protein
MKNYAIIESDIVINAVLASPEYAAEQGWVALPEGAGIGWSFDGTNWTAPPPSPSAPEPSSPTKEELLAQIQALQAQINALP